MTPEEQKLVDDARAFATRHHEAIDQRRKYTNEPYIHHPEAVAALVATVPHTAAQIAAAWCHDTVEDTKATLDDVRRELGDEVAVLVEMLTDVSRPEDGNRAARKAIDLAHMAKASPAAKTVKLADLIDNSRTIVTHAPDFARVYIEEKARLLEVLREGDATLHGKASQIVTLARRQLGPRRR
jgi:(p)ppGpp synthase/HD superfamily hydrolase